MKIERNEKCSCGSGTVYKNRCMSKESDINNPFILSKQFYEREFLPICDLDMCTPKTFLEFDVVLPFHIPMNISRTMTIGHSKGYFSYRFDMVSVNESSKLPTGWRNAMLNMHYTKMLMMAAIDMRYEDFMEMSEKNYNYYFDLLLNGLNEIIISYMTAKKDEDCHYLTKEMLQPAIFVKATDLTTWENNAILFVLHPYVPYEKEILQDEDMQEIGRTHAIVLSKINPFASVMRYELYAKRYFKQGFYQEALLYAQISIETYVRILFKELLREVDSASDEEIEKILEETPFMALIKQKLPHYLGGNWDLTSENSVVSKWNKSVYGLRNKAIHSGRIPTFSETDEALHTAMKFRQFILNRIKANKRKYPRINEYFK